MSLCTLESLFAPSSVSRGVGTFPQLFVFTCPALLRTLLFQSLPSLSSWRSDIQMSHQMHYFFRLLDWFYMWDSFQMPVLNRLVCLQFAWDIEQNSIRCVYGMIYPQACSSAERGELNLTGGSSWDTLSHPTPSLGYRIPPQNGAGWGCQWLRNLLLNRQTPLRLENFCTKCKVLAPPFSLKFYSWIWYLSRANFLQTSCQNIISVNRTTLVYRYINIGLY